VSEARPILFGKLPRHGDFVARNLEAAARAAWDRWLSDVLLDARAALGEGFDAAHDACPPWRFVDGPGDFGPDWRAGAFAPSIDAAGRRFMIMLAVDGLSAGQAGGCGEDIAEAMEGLIYDAFEQGWGADAVVSAAQTRVPTQAAASGAPDARCWTLGGPDHAARTIPGALTGASGRDLVAATSETVG
jgi:type VI secretion system protein ImpM